jgi:hypothetical protein
MIENYLQMKFLNYKNWLQIKKFLLMFIVDIILFFLKA